MDLTRRSFVGATGAVAGTLVAGIATRDAARADAEETATPSAPIDGAFTTRAMGHETWVYVTTQFSGNQITQCSVVSHRETNGIGSYACARIPAAIVEHQSINVPNVRGCSITSQAIKTAVEEAITLSGRNVDDYSTEISKVVTDEHRDITSDVVVVGAGTAGLMAALRMLEQGLSVALIEKLDIPGGSASMTTGALRVAGSQRLANWDTTGSLEGQWNMDLEAMVESCKSRIPEGRDVSNGELPFTRATYSVSGLMADWLDSIGVGFMTQGSYEGAASYGAAVQVAPGMYCGGAGYLTMFLADRIANNPNAQIVYGTTVTDLIQDEEGSYVGVNAQCDDGGTLTATAQAVCLCTGGFAKNVDMLKEYCPDYADFFFNCCSGSTGEGILMGLEAGSPMACLDRYMPAYLATAQSGVELAFIGSTAPGLFVNVRGENLGSAVSHENGEAVKLDENNEDTFYYVFDDSSAAKARHDLTYGMDAYGVIFDREEAVHYDSVSDAVDALGLQALLDAIEANNQAALEATPGTWGAPVYIETREGIWVLPVTPNFYKTSAGLTIDIDARLLDADGNAIPGLYAAGDVTASPEERDGVTYTYGYNTAMAFGWRMADTVVSELA